MESKAAKAGLAKAREAYFAEADRALAGDGLSSDSSATLRKLLAGRRPAAKRNKTSKAAS